MFHVCSYEHILHLYVLYDCVQRCEDTVSVELRDMNEIFFIIMIIVLVGNCGQKNYRLLTAVRFVGVLDSPTTLLVYPHQLYHADASSCINK